MLVLIVSCISMELLSKGHCNAAVARAWPWTNLMIATPSVMQLMQWWLPHASQQTLMQFFTMPFGTYCEGRRERSKRFHWLFNQLKLVYIELCPCWQTTYKVDAGIMGQLLLWDMGDNSKMFSGLYHHLNQEPFPWILIWCTKHQCTVVGLDITIS